MQIDRYNHLLFPRDSSNPATSGKEPASAAIAPAVAKPQAVEGPTRDVEGAPASSVVLQIQSCNHPRRHVESVAARKSTLLLDGFE